MGKAHLWRHPRGYWYVRLDGRYHRITALEGTANFDKQYWEILSGQRKHASSEMNALIESYRLSERWSGLKPRTRSDYEKVLVYLRDKVGPDDISALRRTDMIALMNENAHRVRFANYIQQVTSVLFEHALDLGWAEHNPAKGIRKLKMQVAKKAPHIPWPDAAVARFRNEATPLPKLIFEVGLGSVQRPGDWTRFRWSDYDGNSLRVIQGKTSRTLLLPCSDQLRRALDQAPRDGLTILTRRDGQPLSYRYMSQIMRQERQRLGLLAFDLHALRYRGVMELARANCSDDEIAAFSGHASLSMIRKYAGEARQEMRARSAADKRSRT